MTKLEHIGTPRHSGRYPWGSGKAGYQRNKSFLSYVRDLKKQGLSETQIAEGLGITTSELRKRKSNARAEKWAADSSEALRLKDKGYSNVAIGKRMGVNESVVRSWLDPALRERATSTAMTSEVLKNAVDKKKYIDIGLGTEVHLGVSRTKLGNAVKMLEEDGYKVYSDIEFKQLGTGKYTIMKVLVPPGVTKSEVLKNSDKISLVDEYSEDSGKSFLGVEPVRSVDRKRIYVRYSEDGGADKDGVIELRRGVEDISLGKVNYAQVRVGVDGKRFMKGMAIYNDDIPDGFDIVYNTNKPRGSSDDKVFKPMKVDPDNPANIDPDNPFGSSLRQKHYTDSSGKEQLSALNIVGYPTKEGSGEEGSWGKWSKTLSSQILSKQRPELAKRQLDLAYNAKKEEYDEIMSLTNPAVKKLLLKQFSDSCDSDSVHLKAAALPRQLSQVLLPLTSLKDNEIYAPNFLPGENVVLIRHPHGGIFEIPELVVNNKNSEGKRLIGDARDAVGINPKVAKRLSGADFDGDAVLVIPNKGGIIKTSAPIKSLQDFEPRISYPKVPGMKVMTERFKQRSMGEISNLITDMTIKGANPDEIARAVKHSMVVIDAVTHELDYKRSFVENGISSLKKKYQGGETSGASTIISRAKGEKRVPERKEGKLIADPDTGKIKRVYIDPNTGEKLYEETGRTYIVTKKKVRDPVTRKITYVDIKPKVVPATTKTTNIADERDAFALVSKPHGTRVENIYAEYANSLKSLGNKARKSMIETEDIIYSPSARKTYEKEVSSLRSQLKLALRNKPLERRAQLLANKVISAKKKANPDMEPEELKKIKWQALEEMRNRVGARRVQVKILDRDWEAIQAGAISNNTLYQILLNSDPKILKERSMPRTPRILMTPNNVLRAKSMLSSGHDRSEVAQLLGVSLSTLDKALE